MMDRGLENDLVAAEASGGCVDLDCSFLR